jgi:ribonuclease HI
MTIAAFFDYEKAYNTVWIDGLLYKMHQMKIPYRYISYVRQFLSTRQTVVNINNVNSKEFLLREGLPQGSSISPLLFLIFINDIDVDLDLETAASLFADDTSAWRRDGKIRGSERRLMQEEVDKILAWAAKWKMKVNADKTKSMVISSSTSDQKWDPQLTADSKPIDLVQLYKFLGVTIDSDLRFRSHVEIIVDRCRKRNRVLKCMASKDWGNSLEMQRTIYLQYTRPALEYDSPSWSPWISDAARKSLQRVQNDALRAVVGLTARTPIDFVHLEASVEPLKDRFEKNNLLLREKYKRLGTNDARRRLLEKKASVRLKTRKGLRHAINESPDTLQYKVEELKPPLPPWRSTGFLFDAVELAKKKDQYTTEELRMLTEEKVGKLDSEVIIYTDGSTDGNQNRGGAGVYIMDRRTGNEISRSFAAGEICSSYAAENVALLRALEWLEENSPETATICTDSMSIHEALANDNWKDAQDWVRKVKEKSYVLTGKITILWIPSHCGCEGNEIADQLANEGTKLDQADIPITHDIAQARVRKRKWSVSHVRAKDTYRERRKPKYEEEKEWPRAVRSLYARLRTGHAKELKQYRYVIEIEDDPFCICGEPETIQHVLCDCPILELARRSVFEGPVELHDLVSKPEKCRSMLSHRFPKLKLKKATTDNPFAEDQPLLGRLRRQRGIVVTHA